MPRGFLQPPPKNRAAGELDLLSEIVNRGPCFQLGADGVQDCSHENLNSITKALRGCNTVKLNQRHLHIVAAFIAFQQRR